MIKTNLIAAHFHLNTTALISLFHDITNGLLILCHGWISGCKNSLWDDSGLRRIAENLYVSLFVNQTSHMWVHLPPPPRCLTSGLDSLASVSTRAVALTAWASSCSTSLWVLAASRILGRTREGKKKKKKSSTWEGLQLLFFWHNHGDYSNKLSRPVDGTKKLDSFSAVSAPDADNKEYRLSNRQNHPSFQDHNGSPLWLFHNFTHVIKIFMVLIVESCNKPTEPERRREVLWGTQTGL